MISTRNQTIVELYHQWMLLKHIADRVGISASMVGVVLKKAGIPRPGKPQKKRVDLNEQSVVACWNSGLSTSAIAERFSIGTKTIRDILKRHGIDINTERRTRYDGEGGSVSKGEALQRIASRT